MQTHDGYVLARDANEYERLRAQSRMWEAATARLLDTIGLRPGARCLDAGCGPGEAMRLMAERVGRTGHVTGIDIDEAVGAEALRSLHAAGHFQTSFERADVEAGDEVSGAPFDLVFARLLLLHADDPVVELRRLWTLVAPGGHLVIQDYDMTTAGVVPELDSTDEFRRMLLDTFAAAGRMVDVGRRLPPLFAEAGIGAVDGTDVATRFKPLATDAWMLEEVYRSLEPAALALGVIEPESGDAWRAALRGDVDRDGHHMLMWPLMVGAYKRKT